MQNAVLEDRLNTIDTLQELIAAGGDQAQELRRLPDTLVQRLVETGFFRFTLPQELGGEDASSMDTVEILEHMAALDASVAWNVMLGSEINAMAAGGMEKQLAEKIYLDNPNVIMCGGGGPGSVPTRAERTEDGGVKVWGQTTFISGCHNASWCFMAAPIMRGNEPELKADGTPFFKMWFLERDQWEIVDTWDVAGLRGSGSNDVKADGAYVPPEHVDVDLMSLPAHYPNPVYRIPIPLRLAYNKAAIALGVARSTLDAFSDLAQSKIPMLSSSTLRDRPVAKYRMGEGMADYQAVRAYLMQTLRVVEGELNNGAARPSPKATQDARLACTHVANVCMRVVDSLHNAAGTSGMRMYSPLERKLRDAHACATHRWVSHPLYEDLGGIMLGHEATPEFLGTS